MKTLSIASMVIVWVALMSCSNQKQVDKAPVRPVKYTTVKLDGNEKTSTFSGTTVSKKMINLSFRQSGKIVNLDVKIGQRVTKGELLARLDNHQSQLALEQGQAQSKAAESNLNTAKLSLDRVKKLYKKGSASLSDLEQAKNGYRTAKEGFEAAAKGVAILKEQLEFGKIYAPANGTISSLMAEVDENVAAGQRVAILNSNGPLEISLGIPEAVINEVTEGMIVDVSVPSVNKHNLQGRVVEVANANGPGSATYPVVVDLISRDAAVKSGMAANVSFSFTRTAMASAKPVVPTAAVGEDNEGQFVFLIEKNDTTYRVRRHPVTIGKLYENGFEIASGLSEGQFVATAGLQTLLDNQEVKLQQ